MCYFKSYRCISFTLVLYFTLFCQLSSQTLNAEKSPKNFNILLSGGYLISSFEDQENSSNSFSLSLIGLFNLSPKFLLGGFFETSIKPFETQAVVGEEEIWHFNQNNVLYAKSYNDIESNRKISQTIVGAKAIYLLSQKIIQPFIGGGAGLYFGTMEQEHVVIQEPQPFEIMESESESFKSSLAFHLSTGILIRKSNYGFYFAFNYHFLNRTLDKSSEVHYEYGTYRSPTTGNIEKIVAVGGLPPGGESKGFNNYGLNLGILIGL